jgi:hypothetical protein
MPDYQHYQLKGGFQYKFTSTHTSPKQNIQQKWGKPIFDTPPFMDCTVEGFAKISFQTMVKYGVRRAGPFVV